MLKKKKLAQIEKFIRDTIICSAASTMLLLAAAALAMVLELCYVQASTGTSHRKSLLACLAAKNPARFAKYHFSSRTCTMPYHVLKVQSTYYVLSIFSSYFFRQARPRVYGFLIDFRLCQHSALQHMYLLGPFDGLLCAEAD